MSSHSRPDNQPCQCIEMWRNAIPTARCLPSASSSDDSRPRSALGSSDAPPPSALSDNGDMRPPSAPCDSDVPPPSALSDDDFRLPSPLSSGEGSVRLSMAAVSIAGQGEKYRRIPDHTHSRRGDGYCTRGPCSRPKPLGISANNGSAYCLASARAIRRAVDREQTENLKMQEAIEAAEEGMARLRLLVAEMCGTDRQDDEHRVSGYFADDENESSTALRKSSSVPMPRLAPPPATLESLQSPAYILRSLDPSEIWDDTVHSEPVVHAPMPLRPIREPELLLAGHNNERTRSGPASTHHDRLADEVYRPIPLAERQQLQWMWIEKCFEEQILRYTRAWPVRHQRRSSSI
jgi:hypothetical protein